MRAPAARVRVCLALLVRQDGQSLMVNMSLDLEELSACWDGAPELRFKRTPYVIGPGPLQARVFWEAGLEATTGAGLWPPVRSFAVGESVPVALREEVARTYRPALRID